MEQKPEKPDNSSPTAESLFGNGVSEIPEDAVPVAKEEKTKPQKEEALPQLYMLMSLQNNMFFDAALQSIGYVILGTVFHRRPELDDNKYYLDIKFNPEEHNKCWREFKIQHKLAYTYSLDQLTQQFDAAVERVGDVVAEILDQRQGGIVAGTLRIYVVLNCDGHGNLQLVLTWIEKETQDNG